LLRVDAHYFYEAKVDGGRVSTSLWRACLALAASAPWASARRSGPRFHCVGHDGRVPESVAV